MRQKKIKFSAVIFDLDGTLVDSLEGIADSMNVMLEQRGYPTHSLEAYKYFVGDGIKELLKRALPGEGHAKFSRGDREEPALEQLVKEYRDIYDKKWPQQSRPYEGITGLLTALTRGNIKMGVLSNKADDFTKRMTAKLLADYRFEAVLGARAGVPGKPDPAAALEIAHTMELNPGKIIFLGDSGVDMQTAVNAGMYPVGVLWGFRGAGELLAHGAGQLIEHPLDLLEFMGIPPGKPVK